MNPLLNFHDWYIIINNNIIKYIPYKHQIFSTYINPFIDLTDDILIYDNNKKKIDITLSASWLQIKEINGIKYDDNKINNIDKYVNKYQLKKTYNSGIIINEPVFMIHLCDKCLRYALGHYLYNLFPILYRYKYDIGYMNLKLCFSHKLYTGLLTNLLNILEIPHENIIVLKDNILYNFKNVYTYEIVNNDWNIDPIKWLVSRVIDPTLIVEDKIGYIIYNSTNNSTKRNLINQEDIIIYCKNNNIDILDMGKYSIEEKGKIMSKYTTIITLYGSGINNIMFAPNIKKIITFNSMAQHHAYGNVAFEWMKKIHNKEIDIKYYVYDDGSKDTHANVAIDINWLENALFH